ncbi:MAG: PDZ domain-containing protein, partial [Armatimonadetes bacterium]|nr:PDZ domain-containing protein [Armatimonadota bacterium]
MNRSSFQVRVWLIVLLVVLAAGSFVAGIGVRHSAASGPLLSLVGRVAQIVPGVVEQGNGITVRTDLQPLATFWQVREKILSDFVDPVEDPAELTYGAIRGMVAALGDPYSRFMTPDQYEEFQREAAGQFEGIGAYLEERTVGEAGKIEVIIFSIIPGGPASEADIRPGDVVLGVDDESMEGKHVGYVADLIRGPEGTQVTLTLRREGRAEPITVSVSRRQVTLPPPEHKVIDEKIGYVWLHTFNKQAEAQLRAAIEELLAEDIEALLLDLSDNGGGLLDQARSVTSLFYEGEPVVYVRQRGRQLQPLQAHP